MVEKEQGKTLGGNRGKSGNRKKAPSPGIPKNAAAQAPAKKAADAKKSAAPGRRPGKSAPKRQISAEERYRMIQEAAYLRAERDGFQVDPYKCWLAAEAEVDTRLARPR